MFDQNTSVVIKATKYEIDIFASQQTCQLSRCRRETPCFDPFLPLSRYEGVFSRLLYLILGIYRRIYPIQKFKLKSR